LLSNPNREIRVRECCNVLEFTSDSKWATKLTRANFCKYDKFCLACSTRRAILKIQSFIQWVKDNSLEEKHWYHITFTIRHKKSDTLEKSMDRLMKHKDVMGQYNGIANFFQGKSRI
jgi:hypothetical protein